MWSVVHQTKKDSQRTGQNIFIIPSFKIFQKITFKVNVHMFNVHYTVTIFGSVRVKQKLFLKNEEGTAYRA